MVPSLKRDKSCVCVDLLTCYIYYTYTPTLNKDNDVTTALLILSNVILFRYSSSF